MTDLNRIKVLAGILTESTVNENAGWTDINNGKSIETTLNGSLGKIEFMADGAEYNDGFWKIYIEADEISKADLGLIKSAFVEWFSHAKNVDFGDNVLSVNDVQLTMPNVGGVSMKQFGNVISKVTGLKLIGFEGDVDEVVMDFRNTPIPYAAQYKASQASQLGKEENPYRTDTM